MDWTDRRGHTWTVTAKQATVNGRSEIVGVSIKSDSLVPLTKAVLKELPLINERPRSSPVAVAPVPPRRGVALGPDEFAAIAAVYEQAWSEGRPVQRAVADAFGVAVGTARNRIAHARREGYLPQ